MKIGRLLCILSLTIHTQGYVNGNNDYCDQNDLVIIGVKNWRDVTEEPLFSFVIHL